MKEAVGQPVLPGDDQFWILGGQLVLSVDHAIYLIPHGFTTDGASVPWWGQQLTGWHPWDPPQRWAGICHDWLYSQPGTKRRWADHVLVNLLDSERASQFEQVVMFCGVRVGGWPAFRQDQAQGPRIFV